MPNTSCSSHHREGLLGLPGHWDFGQADSGGEAEAEHKPEEEMEKERHEEIAQMLRQVMGRADSPPRGVRQ